MKESEGFVDFPRTGNTAEAPEGMTLLLDPELSVGGGGGGNVRSAVTVAAETPVTDWTPEGYEVKTLVDVGAEEDRGGGATGVAEAEW
jgi:hypothetical protein